MAKIEPVATSIFDGCSAENLLPQQPQLQIGSIPQDIALKRDTQPYDSPKLSSASRTTKRMHYKDNEDHKGAR